MDSTTNRRSSIYGFFAKKPGSSDSNNTDVHSPATRTRTASTGAASISSSPPASVASSEPSSNTARHSTSYRSPRKKSPYLSDDTSLASPSRRSGSTQAFEPIHEDPNRVQRPEQASSGSNAAHAPVAAYHQRSDKARHPTTQGPRRQDTTRRAVSSSTRSMTLGHGGHVHDVVIDPRNSLQQLQEIAAKRIATLDYLRRTYVD